MRLKYGLLKAILQVKVKQNYGSVLGTGYYYAIKWGRERKGNKKGGM